MLEQYSTLRKTNPEKKVPLTPSEHSPRNPCRHLRRYRPRSRHPRPLPYPPGRQRRKYERRRSHDHRRYPRCRLPGLHPLQTQTRKPVKCEYVSQKRRPSNLRHATSVQHNVHREMRRRASTCWLHHVWRCGVRVELGVVVVSWTLAHVR